MINMLKIGGGECSKKHLGIPISKCPGQFTGGSDGGDGHGTGQWGNHGKGSGVRISQFSMQYFNLTPGVGGTQDEGLAGWYTDVYGGGEGGVLVDGVGPDRESTCQGEGYGGGAGALTSFQQLVISASQELSWLKIFR